MYKLSGFVNKLGRCKWQILFFVHYKRFILTSRIGKQVKTKFGRIESRNLQIGCLPFQDGEGLLFSAAKEERLIPVVNGAIL